MSLEDVSLDDVQVDDDLDIPAKPDADLDDDSGADDDEETVISFGDEEDDADPGENSEGWKKLREERRELKARLAEQDAKLKQYEAPAVEVGPKPTIADCDYDDDLYEERYEAWKQAKAKAEEATTKAQQEQQAFKDQLEAAKQSAAKQRAELKVPDFDDAAGEVMTTLTKNQQTILLLSTFERAKVIYALGKSPVQLARIAAITEPFQFAREVVLLEKGLKMTTKRRAPEPETRVRGSAPLSATSPDKQLDKLRAEAIRTGDSTKVVAYKREMRERVAAKG